MPVRSEHGQEATGRVGPPLEVDLLITRRCNLRCPHCCAAAQETPRSNEASTDEMERVIADMAASGVLVVTLTGGEPLSRNDAPRLAHRVTAEGMSCVITTNGWFVDDEMADELARAGVAGVNVSLDGPREKHDAFRGVEGSYDSAIGAIKRLTERGIPVSANFTATEASMDWLFETLEIASDAGCRALSIGPCGTIGRATGSRSSLLPPWDRWRRLVLEITNRARAGRLPLPVHGMWTGGWQLYLPLSGHLEDAYSPRIWGKPPEVGPELGTCPAGVYVCAITPDGSLHPCDTLTSYPEMKAGNVLETSFDDVWQRSRLLRYLRGVRFETIEPCRTCKLGEICHSGCRGCTYGATGSLQAPDPRCPIVASWLKRHGPVTWPAPPIPNPGEELAPSSPPPPEQASPWALEVGREDLTFFGATRSLIKYARVILARVPGPGVNVLRLNPTAYRLLAAVASGAGPSAIAARLSSLAHVTPERVLSDLRDLLTRVAVHLDLDDAAVRDYLENDPDCLPPITTRRVGDRVLVYSSHRAEVVALNLTAALILELASEGLDKETVAAKVAEAFPAPLPTIRGDVEAFWPTALELAGLSKDKDKKGVGES